MRVCIIYYAIMVVPLLTFFLVLSLLSPELFYKKMSHLVLKNYQFVTNHYFMALFYILFL